MYILYFDGSAFLKNSAKIRNWDRWSDAVDVRFPDIDFVIWVRLQNMLPTRVHEEEILVGTIIWGHIENWKTVYQGIYWQVQMTHI